MANPKLFIPGPTYVRPEINKAMCQTMIGHRTPEAIALYDDMIPKLKKVFQTKNDVMLGGCSGTGLMEAASRNLIGKKEKALHLTVGNFGKRWYEISEQCGKTASLVELSDGTGYTPERIAQELGKGDYQVLFLTHNETTSGVMQSNIVEIGKYLRKEHQDLLFCIDTVSSMSGTNIPVDDIGADICVTSSQKAFALPPGLSLVSVSPRAYEKAKTVKARGHYLDLLNLKKYYDKQQYPTTPPVSLMFGLQKQLDDIVAEGLKNRFARHQEMKGLIAEWVKQHFKFYAQEPFRSDTLTVINNTKDIDVKNLNKELRKRDQLIANGYGTMKDKTFRIAHMGDIQPEDIKELIDNMNDILKL